MFTLKVRTVIVALIVTVMSFSTVLFAIAAGGWIDKSVCHSQYDEVNTPEDPCQGLDDDEEACNGTTFQVTLNKVVVTCFYGTPGYECRYKDTDKAEGEASCKWENDTCTEGTPATKVPKEDCEDRERRLPGSPIYE